MNHALYKDETIIVIIYAICLILATFGWKIAWIITPRSLRVAAMQDSNPFV